MKPERTPLVQGTAEWHRWRQTGVGSSDISVITGDAPWRDADVVALYQEKLGYTPSRVASPSMEAGQWLEDLIARWYAEREGRRVRRINYGLRSRSHPFAIASPDRAVPGRGLLEVKIADHPGDSWGVPGTDQVPDHYLEQALWQAHVADVDVVDVAVFFTRTRRREVYSVGRDPDVIDELLEFGAEFWRHVESRTPPQPVARVAHLPLREDEVEADAETVALVAELADQEARLAPLEEAVSTTRDLLRARLDGVGGARGPGFRIAYRPTKDRVETDWQAVALAYRQMLEELDEAIVGEDAVAIRPDLDRIVAELTTTRPGARPLVVRRTKEN